MNALAVALGSALGGLMRYGLTLLWPVAVGEWPRATMTVNLLGCFAIGAAWVWFLERPGVADYWRLFGMTGVLGGFTTWSAFALETQMLLGAGLTLRAIAYAAATIVGCLLAAWLGMNSVR
jgi:CrcB protein